MTVVSMSLSPKKAAQLTRWYTDEKNVLRPETYTMTKNDKSFETVHGPFFPDLLSSSLTFIIPLPVPRPDQ
jgi:hypothetical protein